MLDQLALKVYRGLRGIIERAQDEEGQTLAEYGLIMAIVGVSVVVLAAVAFKDAIVSAFNGATDCLDGSC